MSSRKRRGGGSTGGIPRKQRLDNENQRDIPRANENGSSSAAPVRLQSAPSSTHPASTFQAEQPVIPGSAKSQASDQAPAIVTAKDPMTSSDCLAEASQYLARCSGLLMADCKRNGDWIDYLYFNAQRLEGLIEQQNLVIAAQDTEIRDLKTLGNQQGEALAALKREIAELKQQGTALSGKLDGINNFCRTVMERFNTVTISDLLKALWKK
ncbi:hypothetical protein BDW75DRAFT_225447 [Aspergillus navahoensis]